MEEWGDKNVLAHTNFRVALEGVRLDRILGDKEELQRLRHDYTALKEECKLLKFVLAHRKIDLEQEVIDRTTPTVPPLPKMSPKGGEWDDEDDEKQARNSVDPARDDSSLSSMESGCSQPIDPVAALRAKRLARFANM